jgi:hypothetical protein
MFVVSNQQYFYEKRAKRFFRESEFSIYLNYMKAERKFVKQIKAPYNPLTSSCDCVVPVTLVNMLI